MVRAKPESISLFPPVSKLFPLHLGRVSGGKGGDSFASLSLSPFCYNTFPSLKMVTRIKTDPADYGRSDLL
jgi:hypothetical protein